MQTAKAPKSIGPYSQGIASSGFVFTAGMIGLDPQTGKIVGPGIREQTQRALESIRAILEEAGTSLARVVKTTVYIKEAELFSEVNEVYSTFFHEHRPARSTVVCSFMQAEVLVEIDAIAEV
ncbi:MAG TPA: Rid family detoxifying hydrolase [Candidatus Bathyarchaeia archaeon]|nr:Rid family detoxifying hydrolase [Candidatus Bathyarchaeia archaeon]